MQQNAQAMQQNAQLHNAQMLQNAQCNKNLAICCTGRFVFCRFVIVRFIPTYLKPLNLEKTTSSVLYCFKYTS